MLAGVSAGTFPLPLESELIMSKKEQNQTEGGEVALKQNTAVALADDAIDYSGYVGAGMEEADRDSFAIPFLKVLQKGSPQVDETKGEYIEGAKAGMLYDNVSHKLYDGKAGVKVVPCHFRRTYIRWGAENGNENFKGELAPEVVATMIESGDIRELENRLYVPLSDGTVHDKKCDRISDTRNHYILVIDPDTGDTRPALLSLSSTQIKKSKTWNADISNQKASAGPGQGTYSLPSFANVYRVTTIPEQNDSGTWYGVRLIREGLADKQLFQTGRDFYNTVKRGNVEAKYESDHQSEAQPSGQADKL